MKLPLKLSRSRSTSPPCSPSGSSPSPTNSSQKKFLRIPFPSRKSPNTRKPEPSYEIVEIPSPIRPAESRRRNSSPGSSPSPPPAASLSGKGKASFSALERVPPTVMREIKQVFAQFDTNGDGRISADELWEVLRSLGEETSKEEAVLMVEEVDADGDGCIDLEEFVEMNTRCLQVTGEMASQEELTAAFEIFDVDKNGRITAEELAAVLGRLGGHNSSLDDCRRMIRGVDRKGLGHVDFDDFKVMMMSTTTTFLIA